MRLLILLNILLFIRFLSTDLLSVFFEVMQANFCVGRVRASTSKNSPRKKTLGRFPSKSFLENRSDFESICRT